MHSLTFPPSALAGFYATMFPAGRTFDANDVFVGNAVLHNLEIHSSTGSAITATITVYDACDSNGRAVVGGTSNAESYRVIAASTDTPYGCYRVNAAAPNAQITNLRQLVSLSQVITPTTGGPVQIDLGDLRPGMGAIVVVQIASAAGLTSAVLNFTPLVTGGTRRRRAYRPGSTTKVQGPAQTSLSL